MEFDVSGRNNSSILKLKFLYSITDGSTEGQMYCSICDRSFHRWKTKCFVDCLQILWFIENLNKYMDQMKFSNAEILVFNATYYCKQNRISIVNVFAFKAQQNYRKLKMRQFVLAGPNNKVPETHNVSSSECFHRIMLDSVPNVQIGQILFQNLWSNWILKRKNGIAVSNTISLYQCGVSFHQRLCLLWDIQEYSITIVLQVHNCEKCIKKSLRRVSRCSFGSKSPFRALIFQTRLDVSYAISCIVSSRLRSQDHFVQTDLVQCTGFNKKFHLNLMGMVIQIEGNKSNKNFYEELLKVSQATLFINNLLLSNVLTVFQFMLNLFDVLSRFRKNLIGYINQTQISKHSILPDVKSRFPKFLRSSCDKDKQFKKRLSSKYQIERISDRSQCISTIQPAQGLSNLHHGGQIKSWSKHVRKQDLFKSDILMKLVLGQGSQMSTISSFVAKQLCHINNKELWSSSSISLNIFHHNPDSFKLQLVTRRQIVELVENADSRSCFKCGQHHYLMLHLDSAGVKSMKYHLKRILGTAHLTFKELQTVLCQIECALNSRPLYALSDDIDDLNVSTTGHFIMGTSPSALPEESFLGINENRLTKWQRTQQMFQDFCKQWSVEYLSGLQNQPKWNLKEENLKVGELVILKEDDVSRAKWLMGRVLQVHPGNDGLVRVVTTIW